MTARHHTFQLGDVTCTALLDGVSSIDTPRFLRRFPDATEAEYRAAFRQIGQSLDKAISSINLLVLRIGGETVLVDTGEGGHLLSSLAAAGLMPDDITLVVLTHTHGDHVLGLLNAHGEPNFPQARYLLSAPELAAWQTRMTDAQRPLLAMMQKQGLRTMGMEEPILPGLDAVPLPGHTPGQIGLRLRAGGQTLLHLADLLHSPMQFAHPEWSAKFDADTTLSVPTRRRWLAQAAEANTLTFFYHLRFPGLGRVRPSADAFTWKPL